MTDYPDIVPPLCVDCLHHTMDEGWTCVRPLSANRSVVDGSLTDRLNNFCANERRDGKTLFTRRERCGLWGQYFTPAIPRRPKSDQEGL